MNTPPWLEEYMSQKGVTDILINGSKEIFVDRGNKLETLTCDWTEEELKAWVLHQISLAGKTWDAKYPFIDASLPSGFRLHVTFPPISKKGVLISLRKLPEPSQHLSRWKESLYFKNLCQAIQKGESIILSGATGSGKTTLANDLLSQVPPCERVIALEDTPELAPTHPHFISLVSRPPNADGCGEVTLRTLLKQALRMRPDRIVLGECRGPEILELLQALNTGHQGAMTTLHANSPREALKRIELLCLLSNSGNIPLKAIRELLAFGIQWIVQLENVNGKRKISEICKIEGQEGETILLRPIQNCDIS